MNDKLYFMRNWYFTFVCFIFKISEWTHRSFCGGVVELAGEDDLLQPL